MMLPASRILAQCDVTIQRNATGYSLVVVTPQTGSNYTWEASGGLSGQGLAFNAPLGAEVVVFRDGAEANRFSFEETGACDDWGVFTYSNTEACNGCTVTFQPNQLNFIGQHWDFGDGNSTNDIAPTHTYSASGTYTVTHTVIIFNGGINFQVFTCTQQVTVNCGGSTVKERVECCNLILNLCSEGSSAGCTHLWEILNSNGTVCLTSTDPNPEFVLENLNTYTNGTITVRHTTNCGGSANVTSFNHTIQNQGIFVGDDVDPNNPVSYLAATGPLNNNQPLFPSLTVSGQDVYVNCILENSNLPSGSSVTFANSDLCFASDAGLNVRTYMNINGSLLYNGCSQAWRGIEVLPGGYQINLASSTLRGAVFAVHYRGQNQTALNINLNQFRQNFIGLYSESPFGSLSLVKNTFNGGTLPALGATPIQAVADVTGGYSQSGSFAGIFVRNVPAVNIAVTSKGNTNTFNGAANGIYLENTNALVQFATFIGQTKNPAYITDNTGHGIYMRHTAAGMPGTMTARDGTFALNETGIRAVSAVANTRVSVGTTIGPNTISARIGVSLEQRPGGRFVNSFAQNNTISGKGTGIQFVCDPTPFSSNVTIRDNIITALTGDGIHLTGPNPGAQNIQVKNNDITVHHTAGISGIHLLNFSGALVDEDNKITMSNSAVRPYRGIWIEGSRNSVIQGNEVTGTFAAGNPVYDNNAVHLANSTDNLIANNLCQNTGRGLFLFGNCMAADRLRCNTFKGTGFGIRYTDMSITGNQTNTGNHWDDTRFLPGGNLIGAAHEGDVGIIGFSKYFTLQGASIQYPQTFELQSGINPGDWFDLGQNAACDPPPPFAPTEAEQLAAGAGIPVGNDYADGFNWVARRYLYRKLLENPGLTALATEFQPFLNAAAGNTIGAYELLRQNAQSAGALDAAAEQQVLALTADADAALAEMHDILDEIETQSPTGAALAQLLSDYAAAEADLTAVYAQIGQVLAPFQTAVSQHAAQAPAAIGALPAAEAWEAREKTLIGMTYKARNGQWLTGADRAYILETAEMCPWEAGLATYQARALWFRLTGEVLPDPECPLVAERTNETTAAVAGDLTVYPNPVAGWFQLRLPGETARRDGLRYQLHNALGAMVQEGQIAGAATDISVQTVPAGMYTFRVLHGDALLHATKIAVIQR